MIAFIFNLIFEKHKVLNYAFLAVFFLLLLFDINPELVTPKLIVISLLIGMFVSTQIIFLLNRFIANLGSNIKPIIPEFTPPQDIKFYEFGLLLKNEFRIADIIASIIHYKMLMHNAGAELNIDHIGASIINRFGTLAKVNDILKYRGLGKYLNWYSYNEMIYKYQNEALEQLVTRGYYRFNPLNKIRELNNGRLVMLIMLLPLILCTIFGPLTFERLVALSIPAFIIMIEELIYIAIDNLCVNHQAIKEPKRILNGYKMYLETTEKYIIESDLDKFEQFTPYFIALDIDEDKWEKLFEHTKEKYLNTRVHRAESYQLN